MKNIASTGDVVGVGEYRCSNCGHVIRLDASESLPPCPNCAGPGIAQGWEAVSDGDRDPEYENT